VFLLAEAAYIAWLKQVGLVRKELDYPDLMYFCPNNKIRSFIANSTIDQEDMLFLVWAAIIILDEIV
jgi:hypothetical protein